MFRAFSSADKIVGHTENAKTNAEIKQNLIIENVGSNLGKKKIWKV